MRSHAQPKGFLHTSQIPHPDKFPNLQLQLSQPWAVAAAEFSRSAPSLPTQILLQPSPTISFPGPHFLPRTFSRNSDTNYFLEMGSNHSSKKQPASLLVPPPAVCLSGLRPLQAGERGLFALCLQGLELHLAQSFLNEQMNQFMTNQCTALASIIMVVENRLQVLHLQPKEDPAPSGGIFSHQDMCRLSRELGLLCSPHREQC